MQDQLNDLKNLLAEVSDLHHAQAVLGWDMQTYMPPGGAESRGYQLGTLAKIAHEMFTSAGLGRLLDQLAGQLDQLDPQSDDAYLIRVTKKQYDKLTRVPTQLVAEFAQLNAIAQNVWQQARAEDNFAAFQPYLERTIEMRRQYAGLFAPYDHIYDPLLDDFESGLKTREVQAIFNTLRPAQVELLHAITQQPQVDDSFLNIDYPEKAQWDFGVEVLTRFGFDWQNGRQDLAVHPFTTSFGSGDVRLTTRFLKNNGVSALFSTMHEGGHGMYDQGIAVKYNRSPLGSAASLAVHESQSRMWENLVGRSLPFWKFFYPRMQALFPEQLGRVSLYDFYRGINRVEPSFIRVEADEATYNLHIMLRLDLEIALIEGSLKTTDLPEAWNALSQEYLGITPPGNRLGVLQDVHWSSGLVGYFPTYALGNLISVQLWEKAGQEIGDMDEMMSRGEFASLLGWLRKTIHQHGAKYEPQELVMQATGSKIDPQPYLRYLKTKYSQIYNL